MGTPIDPELLKQLYVDQALSTVAIAAKLGCAGNTVLRRLRRAGIEIRARGPIPSSQSLRIGIHWTPAMAYALGLMATDGNLSGRQGRLSFVSKDADQVETLRRCLQLEARIFRVRSPRGFHHKIQWCDRGLYDWFLRVGLTPAKSRTIGALVVPDELFVDFFRGCIDGDGSIVTYVDSYHTARSPQYVYERLYVSLVSASRRFLDWLQTSTLRAVGVSGSIQLRAGRSEHPLWALRYSKADSLRILRWMYYSENVPCLTRKRAKALRFLAPLGCAPARSVGRPRVGWLYTDPARDT